MLDFSKLKQGKVIVFQGEPCLITKSDHLKMNRAKPTKRCKLRNLISGNVFEYTFKSGEGAEEADIQKKEATFLYQAGDQLNFMLTDNFETVELPMEFLEDKAWYLKEGLEVQIVYFDNKPINVELPIKVSYQVTNTMEVEKGNTVHGVTKDAELEKGKVIKVPGFIKNGEQIIVNTVEDEYSERDHEAQKK
jgi:elongation factor P